VSQSPDLTSTAAAVKDPVQQKVRAGKAIVNQQAREFVKELISFKKGFNGYGDTSAGLPASRIYQPVPSELRSYLSQLSQSFSDLVSASESVMDSQDSYAESRVQAARSEEITKLANDLSVQAGIWWGWGSHFLDKFRLLGDSERKMRLLLSRALLNCKEELKDFEDQLVHFQDPESIPKSFTTINSIASTYVGAFLKVLPQQEVKLTPEEAKKLEFVEMISKKKSQIQSTISSLPELDKKEAETIVVELFKLVQETLDHQDVSDVPQIEALLKKLQALQSKTKTAKPNLFHKLVNETRLSINPSNQDLMVLECLRLSREVRDQIKVVFEQITTKGSSFKEAKAPVQVLNEKFVKLLSQMYSLGVDYSLDNRRKKKDKESYKSDIKPEDRTMLKEMIRTLRGLAI